MLSGHRSDTGGLRRLAPLFIGLAVIVATFAVVASLGRGPEVPDPGYINTCGTDGNRLTVSHASGFYDHPFALSVWSADNANVFYTLDGTRPETRSTGSTNRYRDPIRVADLSSEPGPLTSYRTSAYFASWDVDSPTWELAGPDMDRGVSVRLRSSNGIECTFVYFVGPDLRRNLPVLHLTLNPDFLFDHDSGIYVLGAHFQEWRDEFDPSQPWNTVGNFSQRGREWERPFVHDLSDAVVMHYFSNDGQLEYSTPLGLRIHGATSRTFPMKALRLYARNEYGNRTFDYPFFGDDGPATHRRLLLRPAGSHCLCVPDWRGLPFSHLTDGYLQSLVGHREIDSQAMVPVALFINGEYWGIHHIRERLDEHYTEIVHGIPADRVIVLQHDPPIEASSAPEWAPVFELLDFLYDEGTSREAGLERLEREFDLDNYLEWLTVELFVANSDIHQNYSLWRAEVPPQGGPLRSDDGRWRWFLYDLDLYDFHGIGESRYNMFTAMESGRFGEVPTRLYTWLVQDEVFVKRLVNRIADQLNSTYLPERTVPILDALETLLVSEMPEHIERWVAAMDQDMEGWQRSVDHLRSFMVNRPGYLWDQTLHQFDLTGMAPVRLLTSEGGVVTVNTVTIDGTTPGVSDVSDWTGRYFAGVPITLRATPNPGFAFAGWEGVPQHLANQPTIQIEVGEPLQIAARFTEGD